MKLYHFTGIEMLRGIGAHGLTVGDVPTDLEKHVGRIGVWFTSSEVADGHGLERSGADKKRMRLSVDVPETPLLVHWRTWAAANVTPKTQQALERANGAAAETWWVFFGWVRPEWIVEVYDTQTSRPLPDWQTAVPEGSSRPGVPYWRREAWQKRMLKDVRQELRRGR